MYTYRKLLAIIILTAFLFCLVACTPAPKAEALDVLKLPAEFKADGERNGVAFLAEISLGGERDDGTRSGEMIFTAPDAFRGLCVRTECDIWEAELDGVKISGIAAEALGAPLAPFMKNNNAESAELIKTSDGETQTLITVPTDGGSVEFFIDSKSGYPILLREKNSAGETVMEFKITDYKIQKTN